MATVPAEPIAGHCECRCAYLRREGVLLTGVDLADLIDVAELLRPMLAPARFAGHESLEHSVPAFLAAVDAARWAV